MAQVPKGGEVYHADDGTVSIVLDDNYDPNYEPPEKEIEDYAKWLGIDVDTERDLFWIARDGLKAPLPKEWKPCKTDTGEVYYFNFKTGDSIWEHPMDDIYKAKLEEERQKRLAGSVGAAGTTKKEKKDKKDKREKAAPEKGSAGFAAGSSSSQAGKKGTSVLADVRPGTTRLGALGDAGGSSLARPDISDLVRRDPGAGSGTSESAGGGSIHSISNSAEAERKLREKYTAEFEGMRKVLQEQQDREIEHLRKQKRAEREKAMADIDSQVAEAVSDAKRAARRRKERELSLYESSIGKQKEDLRRTIQQLTQRFDTENAGVNRRVDRDLEEKRRANAQLIESSVSQERNRLHNEWRDEMTRAELKTESQVRDLQASHQHELDAMRQCEGQQASLRLSAIEDRHVREIEDLRRELAREKERHSEMLQKKGAGDSGSTEYMEAESAFQQAVATARDAAAAEFLSLRAELEAERNRVRVALAGEAQEQAATAARKNESTATEEMQRLRSAAREKIENRERQLDDEAAKRYKAFEAETEKLVRDVQEQLVKRQQAMSSEAAQQQLLRNEMEDRLRSRFAELRRQSALHSEEAKQKVKDEVERMRETASKHSAELLREMITEWEKSNVDDHAAAGASHSPILNPGASSEIAENAERLRLQAEYAAKLQKQRREMEAKEEEVLRQHREKAMKEISERLQAYSLERSGSPSAGCTPTKTSGVSYAANSKHIAARVRETVAPLKEQLQRSIDELAETIRRVRVANAEKLSSIATENALELQSLQQSVLAAASAASAAPSSRQRGIGITGHAGASASLPPHEQYAVTVDAPPWKRVEESASVDYQRRISGDCETDSPRRAQQAARHKSERRFEERLRKAGELLKRKKVELRHRQEALEKARSDWKRDFASAKSTKDEEMQKMLGRVKDHLEERAKRLNREALQVRETSAWLKHEESKFHQRQRDAQRPSSAPAMQQHQQVFSDPTEMMSVLQQIVEKVSGVESRVARMQLHSGASAANPKSEDVLQWVLSSQAK